MTAVQNDLKTGRALVSDAPFNSVAQFTVAHFGQDQARAERQTDQAFACVATAAPGGGGHTMGAVTKFAHAMEAAGFVVLDDLWTVNGENASPCDSDCGRPYGSAGGNGDGNGDSGDDSDSGGGNPSTGDSDDGRDYHHGHWSRLIRGADLSQGSAPVIERTSR
ncbi:hypothetical protein ACFYZ9_36480 [Streptomyces sp. NPDC001691]|uniref:hypothetical protein n=1 Tax=Streptomyces sp. NPDC001691 TaxID=3364600 RepID=UPI00368E7BB2